MAIDSPDTFDRADLDVVLTSYPEGEFQGQPEFLRPTLIARQIIFDNIAFPNDAVKTAAISEALKLNKPKSEVVLSAVRSASQMLLDKQGATLNKRGGDIHEPRGKVETLRVVVDSMPRESQGPTEAD